MQDPEFDAYILLAWRNLLGFDLEKAQRMREAGKGYEDWLEDCPKWREVEEVDFISENDNSD